MVSSCAAHRRARALSPPEPSSPAVLPRYLPNRSLYRPGPRWCIVRNPAERHASCVAWSNRSAFAHSMPAQGSAAADENWFGQPPLPGGALLDTFARGRFGVQWNEELLHKQPQSWFVWGDAGQLLCDCVVAFEKLPLFVPGTHRPRAGCSMCPRPHTPHSVAASARALDAAIYAL